MREFKRVSNRHLLHQEVEVDELLKTVRINKQGYNGQYYGITKQGQLPVCIELALADNSRYAIPYSNITEVTVDLELGVNIYTSVKAFQITGRKLEKLFDYLEQFRVNYIKEHSGADIGEGGIFIEAISAKDR